MKMCKCVFITTTYDTQVCKHCGIEMPHLPECTSINVGYSMSHSPFMFGYSRVKRFFGMATCLLFPSANPQDQRMIEYLDTHPKIKTRMDLDQLIQKSDLRDKRFGSMHFFCRQFVPTYQPPPYYGCLFAMRKRMVFLFERIALAFQKIYPVLPFVNYNYLMRYILTDCKYLYYLTYVKTLKCKKRRIAYAKLLASLNLPRHIQL